MSRSSRNERLSTERTSTLHTANSGRGHLREEAETKKKIVSKMDAKQNIVRRNFVQTGKREE